jgi:hypothetical protein
MMTPAAVKKLIADELEQVKFWEDKLATSYDENSAFLANKLTASQSRIEAWTTVLAEKVEPPQEPQKTP